MDWKRLIMLWHNYNTLLINIIGCMDGDTHSNVWVIGEDTIRLDELIADYYRHLRVHVQHFENRLHEIGGQN